MRTTKPHAQRQFTRKLCPQHALAARVRRLKHQRRRIVFTNGCFDVLHVGHAMLLEQAKRLGDVLIVALNSDRSVRGLKGPGRPIVSQRDRALLLAALASVDYVTIFHTATPYGVIKRLRPDILVKGADWGTDSIVGRDVVERYGGRVVRIALAQGHSTSRLLKRIRSRQG